MPNDDATSYLNSGTTTNTIQYFTTTPSIPAGATISDVQILGRIKRGGASDCTLRVGYLFILAGGETQTGESDAGALTATTNYSDISYSHTGLSAIWGAALVFWIRNTQNRSIHCTTLYAQITYTYTPPTGYPVATRARYVPGYGQSHGRQGW